MRKTIPAKLLFVSLVSLLPTPASAWGPEGHRIVARIATAHLSPAARSHAAALLQSDSSGLAEALAAASTWADDIKQQTRTGNWHFLDLAASDTKAQIASRCQGECVTEKIRIVAASLKTGRSLPYGAGSFTAVEQLKLIVHLMGDLHQPLHCATNADAGGNCLRTAGFQSRELHSAWDTGMIRDVLLKGTTEAYLAKVLDARFSNRFASIVRISDVEDMALESHQVAFQAAYGPLIARHELPSPEPRAFLRLSPSECATKAADFFRINPHPNLRRLYNEATYETVRLQLATGGYRLAELLNAVFQ